GSGDGGAGTVQILALSGSAETPVLQTPAINELLLDGNGGADVFNLSGSLPYAGGVLVNADATVNLTGATGLVTVNLADNTPGSLNPNTVISGYGAPVTLVGVDVANLDANANPLTIDGTAAADNLTYTPTATGTQGAGTVTNAGLNTVFNFSNVTGAFTLDPGTGANTVTVNGTTGNDVINVVRGATATTSTVQVNPTTQTVSLVTADTQSLVVNTGAGTDVVNVSGTSGPASLTVNGGATPRTDTLNVSNGVAGTTTIVPGTTPDAGTVQTNTTDGNVAFTGMRLVSVLGFGPAAGNTLVANGTNGPNTLALQRLGGSDTVWVDSQAPVIFSAFGTVTLNGLFGDDKFNVYPVGLSANVTAINVNGGDPTASDSLIVNGSAAADAINFKPTAPDAGSVTITGSAPVNFATTEAVTINGQGGGDTLTYTSPANAGAVGSALVYTPGTAQDAGSIIGQQLLGGGANDSLVPLTFLNLGVAAANAVVFTTANTPPTDTLTVNGTASSDTFNVSGVNGGTVQIAGTTLPLQTSSTGLAAGNSIKTLNLLGLDGDDVFNLAATLPYTNTLVDGGDPSASDTVNLTGATGLVTVNLGDSTIPTNTTITGYGGTVSLTGVEVANLNANANALKIMGTTGADSLVATPTSASSATVQAYTGGDAQNGQGGTLSSQTPIGPVLNATNVSTATGGFAINGNGGSDVLFVEGTQNADIIDVNDAASGPNAVKVNALLVVNYNAALPHVEIDALAGSDTINIGPSTTTTFLVDGGDPIGVLPGDTLNLIHPAAYVIFPGPTSDSGGMNTAGFQTVSWVHIESITNTNVPVVPGVPAVFPKIDGTNGNDEITVIARDSSYNPAAPGTPNPLLDGVQDFTVSVNGGPEILFINTPFLFIDSLSGNDDIVVREPAAQNEVWNVQVYVAAGAPASGSNGLGDNIELETPGTQTVTYNPNNPLSSIPPVTPPVPGLTFTIPAAGGGQFSDAGNTSTVTATQYLIPGLQQSSPGGAENFIYAGEAGNDTLIYNSPANANAGSNLVYTPGANPDAGTIAGTLAGGAALTPLTFSNLGVGATNAVVFTTANTTLPTDTLRVNGTAHSDTFNVSGVNGGTVQIAGTTLPLQTSSTGLAAGNSIK
ncbi:MAG: hypothetical protein ABSH20_26060, partial [Tepidisphaeraceae bacterium]